jgi:hypothetical protein
VVNVGKLKTMKENPMIETGMKAKNTMVGALMLSPVRVVVLLCICGTSSPSLAGYDAAKTAGVVKELKQKKPPQDFEGLCKGGSMKSGSNKYVCQLGSDVDIAIATCKSVDGQGCQTQIEKELKILGELKGAGLSVVPHPDETFTVKCPKNPHATCTAYAMKWMSAAVPYEGERIWKPLIGGIDYKDDTSLDAAQTQAFVKVVTCLRSVIPELKRIQNYLTTKHYIGDFQGFIEAGQFYIADPTDLSPPNASEVLKKMLKDLDKSVCKQ